MAGIIDGEGYISIHINTTTSCRTYRVKLEITSTSIEWLTKLRERWGNIGYLALRTGKGNYKDAGYWTMVGATAKGVLAQVRPYLEIKADRADLALQFVSGERGKRTTPERTATQKELADRLKVLNQRGVVAPVGESSAIH